MSAPPYSDLLYNLNYYKESSNSSYFILVEILENYYLIKMNVNDDRSIINGILSWIFSEQRLMNMSFLNKPMKSVFNFTKTRKYQSLISNKGAKITNIIKSISDFTNMPIVSNNMDKQQIKTFIKEQNINSNIIFGDYIDEEVNTETLNDLNSDVNVIYTFFNFNFLNFLLLYDVPFVMKEDITIFCFRKKEFEKFFFDSNFLSNLFLKKTTEEIYITLSLLKKYSEYNKPDYVLNHFNPMNYYSLTWQIPNKQILN